VSDVAPDDERAMLGEFLDWYRGVVEHKLDGLLFEDATRASTPSGVTLLGAVKHLAWVERRWFDHFVKGEPADALDAHTSFVLDDGDTLESVIEAYRDACAHARTTVAASSLDAPMAAPHGAFGTRTVRWVMQHMIEETARHAGHLDVLRELTDGRTGD